MKPGLKKFFLFSVALIYMLSRVVIITPDAIDKKSKRIIYFQQRYITIGKENKHKMTAAFSIVKVVLNAPEKHVSFSTCLSSLSDDKSAFHFCYRGLKILAVPGQTEDHPIS